MPDYAGANGDVPGIKFPIGPDRYNTTGYTEPKWWEDLALTAALRMDIIAAGLSQVVELSDYENILNLSDGLYVQSGGDQTDLMRGYPEETAGLLEIRSSPDGTVSWATYETWGSHRRIWKNRAYNGTWLGWYREDTQSAATTTEYILDLPDGIYSQTASNDATPGRGYPVQQAGKFDIRTSATSDGMRWATYHTFGNHNELWVASAYQGNWSEWKKIGASGGSGGVGVINQAHETTARSRPGAARADGTFSPSAWAGPAAAGPLETPTHDGSGQATHPSVVDLGSSPVSGYRYWMALTPYPDSNSMHEDPNILASNNGDTWVVPPGLTNPLDDRPGGVDYNSDTELVYEDGQFYCMWRAVDGTNIDKFYWRTSTDGITWTPTRLVYERDSSLESALSPSLIRTVTGWRMYVVTNRWFYVDTTSADPGPADWGSEVYCDFTMPPGKRIWHAEVRLHDGQWWALLADKIDNDSTMGTLRLARSDDGQSWDVSSPELIPHNNGSSHEWLYRSAFTISGNSADPDFDLWYSGISRDNEWWIHRSTATRLSPAVEPVLVAEELDRLTFRSGVRDVSSLLVNATGEVSVERRGDMVTLYLNSVTPTPDLSSGSTFFALPAGFGPTRRYDLVLQSVPESTEVAAPTRSAFLFKAGTLGVWSPDTADFYRLLLTFPTDDDPPTTLPGIPG